MLTIGEVAKSVGINIGAIRFYERKGLLEPAARSEQNNRLYTENELNWLVFIKFLDCWVQMEQVNRRRLASLWMRRPV